MEPLSDAHSAFRRVPARAARFAFSFVLLGRGRT